LRCADRLTTLSLQRRSTATSRQRAACTPRIAACTMKQHDDEGAVRNGDGEPRVV
jgi:hypothetical protein